MTMNCATQQTANSHTELERLLSTGGGGVTTGLALVSTLTGVHLTAIYAVDGW
jgi:hypothetical protein